MFSFQEKVRHCNQTGANQFSYSSSITGLKSTYKRVGDTGMFRKVLTGGLSAFGRVKNTPAARAAAAAYHRMRMKKDERDRKARMAAYGKSSPKKKRTTYKAPTTVGAYHGIGNWVPLSELKFNRFKGLVKKKPSFSSDNSGKLRMHIHFDFKTFMKLRKQVRDVLDAKLPNNYQSTVHGGKSCKSKMKIVYGFDLKCNVQNKNKILKIVCNVLCTKVR